VLLTCCDEEKEATFSLGPARGKGLCTEGSQCSGGALAANITRLLHHGSDKYRTNMTCTCGLDSTSSHVRCDLSKTLSCFVGSLRFSHGAAKY
jgi:hypothetical protein